MNKKIITILFFTGILTFSFCILCYLILDKKYSYKIYFLMLFLSTCFILPQSIHDVKRNKATVQNWRILVSNIMGVIFTFVVFLLCLVKGI